MANKPSLDTIFAESSDKKQSLDEIFATPKKKGWGLGDFNKESAIIAEEISKRGQIQDIIGKFKSPKIFDKVTGGMEALGSPFTVMEAAVANPSLEMQRGNFNPIELARQSALGISGQKLGQYGDVYRGAGMPKPLAATMGLGLSLSTPLKTIKVISKTFGKITKMSDRGIAKAGESLLKATEEATTYAGTKLDEAFKAVDTIQVDPTKFYDAVSKLPKVMISSLEEAFGSMEELSKGITTGNIRQVTQHIGKLKPTSFGKAVRGVAENIEVANINKVYGTLKTLLYDSIKSSADAKTANALIKLFDTFSDVRKSSDFIKKAIIDPTLLKATRAGKMAQKLALEGDTSGRVALNTLKQSGGLARKHINKAVYNLEQFNKWQNIAKFGQHVSNAALFGGVVGGIGGFIASKMVNKTQGK